MMISTPDCLHRFNMIDHLSLRHPVYLFLIPSTSMCSMQSIKNPKERHRVGFLLVGQKAKVAKGDHTGSSCAYICLLTSTYSTIRCNEIHQEHEADKAALTKRYNDTKAALDSTHMKYDATHAELARLQKISGINEENLRLEITALTDRCLRLTNLQEAESALRKRYEDKANKYDVAETELVKLKKEVRFT